MREISNILKKYDLRAYKYEKNGKAIVTDTNNGKYVVKLKKRNNNNIYQYLNSRSFNYYPRILNSANDNYEITEYIEQIDMPSEQKLLDMIDLVTLLHNKTTYYKEATEDDYKKIYEDIKNNIEYLNSYYNDIITVIDSKVYMSPSEYLIARNITKIFSTLYFCEKKIEEWYKMVEKKDKQRVVVLHNNLSLDHFLRSKNAYLINWDKSKIDIPIFDLYKLYKKHALDYDFEILLKHYENKYPLSEDERILFFILISLPEKIEFTDNEFEMCKKISQEIELLYKTEKLILPYYSK